MQMSELNAIFVMREFAFSESCENLTRFKQFLFGAIIGSSHLLKTFMAPR